MIKKHEKFIQPETLSVWSESLPLQSEFRIARGAKTTAEVLMCKVQAGESFGIGEAVPYARYGETMQECLNSLQGLSDNPPNRKTLQSLLPAGAARNALDSALWDLERKLLGKTPQKGGGEGFLTAWTISGGSPAECVDNAALHMDKSLLKLKLLGDGLDGERIVAVRNNRRDVRLILDANESWDVAMYLSLLSVMVDCGVELLEQPFAVSDDGVLAELERPIKVCADESCLVMGDLERLVGLYDVVNIKLDKCGGLTHGLEVRERALELGFGLMVGCMVCSGIGIGMALGLVEGADWVDLDGGLWVKTDRGDIIYEGDRIFLDFCNLHSLNT